MPYLGTIALLLTNIFIDIINQGNSKNAYKFNSKQINLVTIIISSLCEAIEILTLTEIGITGRRYCSVLRAWHGVIENQVHSVVCKFKLL